VTIVNRSHDEAAIHWHGIELESFPDGVPNWSGAGRTTLPMIAPHDSLTVRFTPPRAGTFIYHSHANEMQQISSGLYGALIVTEPGQRASASATRSCCSATRAVAELRQAAPADDGQRRVGRGAARAEGRRADAAAADQHPQRLRSRLTLLDGETTAQWRVLAKDGADSQPNQTTPRRRRCRCQPARRTTSR
jgi:FtsP/CotA-like multicopper oxidase with cupredoxin domain